MAKRYIRYSSSTGRTTAGSGTGGTSKSSSGSGSSFDSGHTTSSGNILKGFASGSVEKITTGEGALIYSRGGSSNKSYSHLPGESGTLTTSDGEKVKVQSLSQSSHESVRAERERLQPKPDPVIIALSYQDVDTMKKQFSEAGYNTAGEFLRGLKAGDVRRTPQGNFITGKPVPPASVEPVPEKPKPKGDFYGMISLKEKGAKTYQKGLSLDKQYGDDSVWHGGYLSSAQAQYYRTVGGAQVFLGSAVEGTKTTVDLLRAGDPETLLFAGIIAGETVLSALPGGKVGTAVLRKGVGYALTGVGIGIGAKYSFDTVDYIQSSPNTITGLERGGQAVGSLAFWGGLIKGVKTTAGLPADTKLAVQEAKIEIAQYEWFKSKTGEPYVSSVKVESGRTKGFQVVDKGAGYVPGEWSEQLVAKKVEPLQFIERTKIEVKPPEQMIVPSEFSKLTPETKAVIVERVRTQHQFTLEGLEVRKEGKTKGFQEVYDKTLSEQALRRAQQRESSFKEADMREVALEQARKGEQSKLFEHEAPVEAVIIKDLKSGKKSIVFLNKKGQIGLTPETTFDVGKVYEKGRTFYEGFREYKFKSPTSETPIKIKVDYVKSTKLQPVMVSKFSSGQLDVQGSGSSIKIGGRISNVPGTATGSEVVQSSAISQSQFIGQQSSTAQDVMQVARTPPSPTPFVPTQTSSFIRTEITKTPPSPPSLTLPPSFQLGTARKRKGEFMIKSQAFETNEREKGVGRSSYVSQSREEMIKGKPGSSEWAGQSRVDITKATERRAFLGGVKTPFMKEKEEKKKKKKGKKKQGVFAL